MRFDKHHKPHNLTAQSRTKELATIIRKMLSANIGTHLQPRILAGMEFEFSMVACDLDTNETETVDVYRNYIHGMPALAALYDQGGEPVTWNSETKEWEIIKWSRRLAIDDPRALEFQDTDSAAPAEPVETSPL